MRELEFFNVGVRKSVMERPSLLFYCQHSLGMGHLVRSLALADGLSESFRVVLLNGGPLPKGIRLPEAIEVIDLPPLGFDANGELVSRDGRRTVERAKGLRRQIIMETFRALSPEVLLIELFPFGRKKFSGELMPLLEEAQGRATQSRPLVVCSLRDILVGRREKQEKHDERAARLANDYFDAILVHSEPAFARLEESFHPQTPLGIPVHYTGFVLPERRIEPGAKTQARGRRVIVSAGGGLVGERLLSTAVEAHALLLRCDGDVETEIVAGPFLPDKALQTICRAARGQKGLRVRRFVPDLVEELRASSASVSQCGYNTALDILRANVPALVVPFADGAEDEQMKRAQRLADLGALRVLVQEQMSAERLAEEIRALFDFQPKPLKLDFDGARNSTRLLEEMLRMKRARASSFSENGQTDVEVHA